MKETTTEEERLSVWRGEAALLGVVIINSLGVLLMIHAGSGVSAISSLPYAISLVLPGLTLGTWTYLFQGLLVLSLMALQRRFIPSYLFSFVVGFAFGKMLDVYDPWVTALPVDGLWPVVWFVLGYSLVVVGIALSNRCGLPIIPTDLFPRELSQITGIPYPRIKISFDVICLSLTACMTVLFLGHLEGLGIGTVAAALTMGKAVGLTGAWLDRRVRFVSVLTEKKRKAASI